MTLRYADKEKLFARGLGNPMRVDASKDRENRPSVVGGSTSLKMIDRKNGRARM